MSKVVPPYLKAYLHFRESENIIVKSVIKIYNYMLPKTTIMGASLFFKLKLDV